VRRGDGFRAFLATPWHLLRGLVVALPGLLVAASVVVVVGGIAWWLLDTRRLELTPPGNEAWVYHAVIALAVLAGPLTATIFGYGEFGAHDVRMAALALAGYAPGLLGFSLVKVLAPGYFARQDARTPVRLGLIALGVNLGFNVLVVLPAFAVGFPTPHVLLAVSTSLSGLINAVLLWRGLAREGFCRPRQGWSGMLSRILVATLVMAALVWWLAGSLQSWVDASPLERAWRCALCVVAGAGTYFGCLLLLGMRPHHFMGRPA